MKRTYYAILMPGETEPTIFFGDDIVLEMALADARAAAEPHVDKVKVMVVDVDILAMRER